MRVIKERGCKPLACIVLFVVILTSCVKETPVNEPQESFIAITANTPKVRAGIDQDSDDNLDYLVHTVRILAFDKYSGACVSNVRYNAGRGDIIRHPIDKGEYDLVLLANEPTYVDVEAELDNINWYNDLNYISYPAVSFDSERIIPMIQQEKDVEVLSEGQAQLSNGTITDLIHIDLDRLGVRIDVTLKSINDLDSEFNGITLTEIPDRVPLTLNYTGIPINRDQQRFVSRDLFTVGQPEAGIAWKMQTTRIVIPSNYFVNPSEVSLASRLTVNFQNKYNPTVPLKIEDGNYTLPPNTWLDFLGKLTHSLEVNIDSSKWTEERENWYVNGPRKLNVSEISVELERPNSTRLSFWSNMPVVRVLEVSYLGTSGTEFQAETNYVFNELAVTEDNAFPANFHYEYDPVAKTGSGYMDISVNGNNNQRFLIFRIILSAENEYGTGQLQREITIRITPFPD